MEGDEVSKLTESQLAEIAAKIGTRSGPTSSTLHQEPTFSESEVRRLLNHIAAVTAERDEAEANIGEVNQLLADTLSRTKSAEQRAEDAARVERDAVVAWLKQRADDQEDRGDDVAIRMAAYAIERGEHKGGGDGK